MPLQATSGAASYDAFGGGVAAVPNYIEDVFSTYLYTGNGSTQTITNGIDLAGEGGLVWTKNRIQTYNHTLISSANGVGYQLESNTTAALANGGSSVISSFNSDGFSVGNAGRINYSGDGIASWTFRKQPKFFDVVTYTGTGSDPLTINHNLQSVPGCIIVKCTSTVSNWRVHSTALDMTLTLNTTNAGFSPDGLIKNLTSTTFQVNNSADVNNSGQTYVAYLFAHNAGGFGLTGTDNVISCGSFTCDGNGNGIVNLGYEPQWVLYKRTDSASYGDWRLLDTMRGWVNGPDDSRDAFLKANSSDAESLGYQGHPTATGFEAKGNSVGSQFIYIAIRRGPMKVPTSGTSVFAPVYGTSSAPAYNSGFVSDAFLGLYTLGDSSYPRIGSRLTGTNWMQSSGTGAETADGIITWDYMSGVYSGYLDSSYVGEIFRRAPSFFDEVCETSTSATNKPVTHNLAAVPELIIVKKRSASGTNWVVYASPVTTLSQYLALNTTAAKATSSNIWGLSAPTSTTFNINENSVVGSTGSTYVAYLFATCAGVSKVGSYTGTGTTKQVDCGFTGGARFVLIKRTDSTGDWYVWDSARGIVSGNDPYLLLNSTAAEVTSTDYVDTYSAGFEISSTAPAAINASGGTFIFLAIA